IKAITIQIIVVPDVECCSRSRRPTKQELTFVIRSDRIEINSAAREDKACKLIGGLHGHNILVKCQLTSIVTAQTLFVETKIDVQRFRRPISYATVKVKGFAWAWIPRRQTHRRHN